MRLSIVAPVLAFLAIPTIASAHGGNNDPNVVHACIGNGSKIVRIVGVSGSCLSASPLVAETPAHWDIQGPQGVPGTNGTNGINGTNGTNGINGIDGTSVTFVDYFSGNQGGCPNGGAIYAAGNPPVNAYVCNGKDGKDGQDATGATRADGPCFDNLNRYVNCGNGTVTDTVTGLIWLQDPSCFGIHTYVDANSSAARLSHSQCGLTDNSSAGDWRLPTKDEWSATIAPAVALGCVISGASGPPSLTNDAGTACYGNGSGSSFAGVAFIIYWSSSSGETFPNNAWIVRFVLGDVVNSSKEFFSHRVWPVRGGPR